jgi:putative peptidoglycan lipid II flippase
VPAAVALYVTGSALTRAFYAGGAYSVADSIATGTVVSALVVGLPAYVLVKVLTPGFFARNDTRTPVFTSAASLCINVALNFVLVPRFGVKGLALAGSVSAWANCAMLYGVLASKGHFHLTAMTASRIARIVAASAVMGGLLWWIEPLGAEWFVGSVWQRVLAVAGLVGAGMACFFALAWAMGVVNKQTIGQLRRRKV